MAGNLGKKKPGAGVTKSKPKPSPAPPPRKSREEHKGKVPGAGGLAEVPPSNIPAGAEYVGGRKKNYPNRGAAEHAARVKRNEDAYQGRRRPRTKHEKVLANRGKAVRHILAGGHAGELKGKTPFQNLKQTSILNEQTLKHVSKEVNHLQSRLKNKKLSPIDRGHLQAQLTGAKSITKRLQGRRHLNNAYHLHQESKKLEKEYERIDKQFRKSGEPGSRGELEHIAASKRKLQDRLLRAAEKERKRAEHAFQKSHKREAKTQAIEERTKFLPTTKGSISRRKLKQIRTAGRTGPLGIGLLPLPKRAKHAGKGRLFFVPKQEIKGDPFHQQIGGGLLSPKEIRALGRQSKAAAEQPSATSVGITAATLASGIVAPEAKLLQLAGKGVEALRATKAGEAVVEGIKGTQAFKSLELYRTKNAAIKAVQMARRANQAEVRVAGKAQKEAARIAALYPKGAKAAEGVKEIAIDTKQAQNVENMTKHLIAKGEPTEAVIDITRAVDNSANKALGQAAQDSRGIAGGGAPDDVAHAMAANVMEKASKILYPTGRFGKGIALRAKRGAIKGGIGTGLLFSASMISPEFRHNAERDVNDLVHGFVPSTYEFLTASGQGLAYGLTGLATAGTHHIGSPDRIEAIWHGLLKTSPVALALQGKFSAAEKAFIERPVTGLIEVGGAYTGLGRGLGAVGRALPGEVGATGGRASIPLFGNVSEIQTYSENLINKQLQKLSDRKKQDFIDSLHPMYDPTREKWSEPSWLKHIKSKDIGQQLFIKVEKHIDEFDSVSKISGRAEFGAANKDVIDLVREFHKDSGIPHKQRRNLANALYPVLTKIAKNPDTAVADITKYKKSIENNIKKLEGEHIPRTSPQITKKQTTVDILNAALQTPELFKHENLWKYAQKMADAEDLRQKALVNAGALSLKQAEFAPWVPYAVHHMEARYKKAGPEGAGFYATQDVSNEIKTQESRVANAESQYKLHDNRLENLKEGLKKAKPEDKLEIRRRIKKAYLSREAARDIRKEALTSIKELKGKKAKKLTVQDIRKHASDNEVHGTPMMLTGARPDMSSLPNYEVLAKPSLENLNTTGDLVISGNVDNSITSVINQTSLSQSILHRRRVNAVALDRFSMTQPFSKDPISFSSEKVAQKAADNADPQLGLKLVPMEGNSPTDWRLVPERLVTRLAEHKWAEQAIGKVFRRINNEFKGSVLAFSPKWHIGNLVDMSMRLMFEGAGPHSYAVGRKLLEEVKNIDKTGHAYNDVLSTILGGHYAATHDLLDRHIDLERIQYDKAKEIQGAYQQQLNISTASAIRLGKRGYQKFIATPYRGAQRASFKGAGFLEHHLKTAALGKAALKEAERLGDRSFAKQLTSLGKGWDKAVMLQPDVLTKLAHGIVENDNVLAKYGKYVNKVMGDYTTMSPELRATIMSIVPFGLWLRAATKFVLGLPANSPARTAMVASVNRLNQKEREALGLSPLAPEGGLEDYLQGSLPTLSGAIPNKPVNTLYRTNSYTSFGPLMDFSSLSNFFIPQFNSILYAVQDKEWLGEEIVKEDGTPLGIKERLGVITQQLMEAYIYPLTIAHKVVAKGTPDSGYSGFYNLLFDPSHNPLKNVTRRKLYPPGEFAEPGEKVEEGEAKKFDLVKGPLGIPLPHPTKGLVAEIAFPLSQQANKYIEHKRFLKEGERKEGGSGKVSHDEKAEWLTGVKTAHTRKTDKRVKSASSAKAEWLGE